MNNCLRSCDRCGGHHVGHDSASFGGRYFCPRCFPLVRPVDFDPQPNDCVRFIDGPQHAQVVLSREGDFVTLRRLGLPDSSVCRASVHNLW